MKCPKHPEQEMLPLFNFYACDVCDGKTPENPDPTTQECNNPCTEYGGDSSTRITRRLKKIKTQRSSP